MGTGQLLYLCLAEVEYRPISFTYFITLWPRQNDRHFPDDTFKCISCICVNESVYMLIRISLKFVRKVPINNNPASVHVIVWRRAGSLLTYIYVAGPWCDKVILGTGTIKGGPYNCPPRAQCQWCPFEWYEQTYIYIIWKYCQLWYEENITLRICVLHIPDVHRIAPWCDVNLTAILIQEN